MNKIRKSKIETPAAEEISAATSDLNMEVAELVYKKWILTVIAINPGCLGNFVFLIIINGVKNELCLYFRM